MQSGRRRCPLIIATVALLLAIAAVAAAQARPPVDRDYARFFYHYNDAGQGWWRALQQFATDIGLREQDVGRSFALVAGVSRYPNMGVLERDLAPARYDVANVREYLRNDEFFDEIVVLEDEDVTLANLEYFLQTYFPTRLRQFPRSRFVFAYSGHGMTQNMRGYLLRSTAENLKDRGNAISLNVVRALINESVDAGHHVLVLLNACYAGAFLNRSFGDVDLAPRNPGAHAIVAGGPNEEAWHDPRVGEGSVFFEKTLAGLQGFADYSADGIVTTFELATYLRSEIRQFSNQQQNPDVGDLSRNRSTGEFFFLNRSRRIALPPPPPPPGDYDRAEALYQEGQYTDAYPLFLRAAYAGHAGAMASLGVMYVAGRGVDQNNTEAVHWLRRGAEAGNALAMANLGFMYRIGRGVAQSDAEAVHWFRLGAEAGHSRAMTNLGLMYRDGRGVTQSYTEAVRWFHMGAEASDDLAMANLGLLYMTGQGVAQNHLEAGRWFRLAAEAGNALAMTNLGFMYRDGQGVAQQDAEAARWFRLAAEAGNALAMANLGLLHVTGQGVTQDNAEAIRWFRLGAEAGDATAMASLGFMYRDGRGVAQDDSEAAGWFRLAAEAGNTLAMANLGLVYRDGRGVTQDDVEAIRWFRQAAESGDANGMRHLAAMYEAGRGVAQDNAEAVRWFRQAAALGDEFSTRRLHELTEPRNQN